MIRAGKGKISSDLRRPFSITSPPFGTSPSFFPASPASSRPRSPTHLPPSSARVALFGRDPRRLGRALQRGRRGLRNPIPERRLPRSAPRPAPRRPRRCRSRARWGRAFLVWREAIFDASTSTPPTGSRRARTRGRSSSEASTIPPRRRFACPWACVARSAGEAGVGVWVRRRSSPEGRRRSLSSWPPARRSAGRAAVLGASSMAGHPDLWKRWPARLTDGPTVGSSSAAPARRRPAGPRRLHRGGGGFCSGSAPRRAALEPATSSSCSPQRCRCCLLSAGCRRPRRGGSRAAAAGGVPVARRRVFPVPAFVRVRELRGRFWSSSAPAFRIDRGGRSERCRKKSFSGHPRARLSFRAGTPRLLPRRKLPRFQGWMGPLLVVGPGLQLLFFVALGFRLSPTPKYPRVLWRGLRRRCWLWPPGLHGRAVGDAFRWLRGGWWLAGSSGGR